MKKIIFIAFVAMSFSALMISCDEKTVEVIVDESKPQGTFTADRSGTFIDQNAAGSAGTAELGTDENGTQFLKFNSDFMTALGTGTVTVYFSTSMDYITDPATGNPDLTLAGICQMNGENYYKMSPAVGSEFTHVILWCGSANIPFGYAALN